MLRSNRRQLAAMVTSGVVSVAAAVLLTVTARSWYTPAAEAVGFLAAVVFAWFGFRWSFSVLADVYGD